jgi:apolipoprotein N-acyltransferase
VNRTGISGVLVQRGPHQCTLDAIRVTIHKFLGVDWNFLGKPLMPDSILSLVEFGGSYGVTCCIPLSSVSLQKVMLWVLHLRFFAVPAFRLLLCDCWFRG